MEIHNLENLRTALEQVPKKVLGHFCVSQDEDGELSIGCTKGEEEGEMFKNFQEYTKSYSVLRDIDGFFRECGEEVKKEGSDGYPVEYPPR